MEVVVLATLNFSPIMRDDGVVAVSIHSQEQSDHFLAEAYLQYGLQFRKREGYFPVHKERTVYISRYGIDARDTHLSYTSIDSAISSGYIIVQFEELLYENTLDFGESDVSGLLSAIFE